MRPHTKKRWLARVLLCALSLAVALAVCEVLLREYEYAVVGRQLRQMRVDVSDATVDMTIGHPWDGRGDSLLHIRSRNDLLVYELRPNAEVYVERFGRVFRTNSHGFRDVEFDETKPSNVFRIIALGDSVTFGWEVDANDTYAKILERLLNQERGRPYEFQVYNLGITGYNSEQVAELARVRALRFAPDALLIGYVLNDTQIGADGGLWRHFTRSRLRTVDFCRLQWLRLREKHREEDITTRSFEVLGRIARTRRVPVIVAIFPGIAAGGKGVYPPAAEHKRVAAIARSSGLLVLDLRHAFLAAGLRENMVDSVHPNPKGIRLAASQICDFLRRQVLPGAAAEGTR